MATGWKAVYVLVGAKNAVLPIIAGTLLASTPSKLLEIPNLEDVGTICQVIESLGVKITRNEADDEIIFDCVYIDCY